MNKVLCVKGIKISHSWLNREDTLEQDLAVLYSIRQEDLKMPGSSKFLYPNGTQFAFKRKLKHFGEGQIRVFCCVIELL